MKNGWAIRILMVTMIIALAVAPVFATGAKEDSAAGTGKAVQTLVYNAVSETKGYDPMSSAGLDQRTLINACFEGLLRVSETTGEYIPGQAERYEVLDGGLRYRFYLRKGITWSDGKPVVAGDFEYAMKKQLEPSFASASANNLYFIKNAEAIHKGEKATSELAVKAIDDSTLDIILHTANPFVKEWFAHASTFPVRKDMVEANPEGWTLDPATYISNGPFKMVAWNSQESIEMVKNEQYWNKGKVALDKLSFVFIADETTALAALRTGEIDVTERVPASEIPNLIDTGIAVVTPMGATYYYSINMNPDMAKDPAKMKAIWNKDVRQALNLAIDRHAITTNLLKGGQIPAYGFIPEGIIGPDGKDFRKSKSYYNPKGDIVKAKSLLAKAGYPDGKGFPVYEIYYNTDNLHATVAQAVQDMWRKNLGIEITLVNKETKVFAEERAAGQHEIARSGNLTSLQYPAILDLFMPSNMKTLNDPKWLDDTYVSLITKIKASTDAQEIFNLSRQAEDILMDQMVVFPIFYYTRVLAKNPSVDGIYVKGSMYFDRAFLK